MVDSATANLRAAVAAFASSFDAATIEVGTAKTMVRDWAAIENTAATIKAMAAARVARADRWDRIDGKSAADWLAGETGTTAPKAQQQISTGARLAELDETAAAARRGELSPEQAAAIADASAVDPSAESALLTGRTVRISSRSPGTLRDDKGVGRHRSGRNSPAHPRGASAAGVDRCGGCRASPRQRAAGRLGTGARRARPDH